MTWQLRRARAADVDDIMALETRIFLNDAWSIEAMAEDVANSNCYYLVAFRPDQPDRVEAYAGLLAPPGSHEGDIQTIAVTEQARGHGLGRTLMLSLINEARKRGVREVFLEVRADNPPARELYRRLSFEELGIRRGYYQPDNIDAIVMRLHVSDPEMQMTPAEGAPEATE